MASWSKLKKEETGTAPHFVQPLKPKQVKANVPFILQCTVVGSPTPQVKWYADKHEVAPQRGKSISYNPETGVATLKILKPLPADFCVYSVHAINSFGVAESRANVFGEARVLQKPSSSLAPSFLQPLEALIINTEMPVQMGTEFRGFPLPEVKWFKNGKEIVPTSNIYTLIEENKTYLHISKASKLDSGKYEVRAVNSAGEARSSGTLSITEPQPEMAEVVPPKFIKPLEPQIVAEGEVVILETHVESHPTCSFQWFQQTEPIKSSTEMQVVSTANKSILMINEAVAQLGGTYTCRAENVAGSITCCATINVLPEIPYEESRVFESPRFIKKLSSARIMDGEPVTLTCQVVGKPIPKIKWLHKNKPLQEAKDITVFQDSEGVCQLAIQEVFPEDAGEYTCCALNTMGEAICSASLVVEAYEYVPDSEISAAVGSSLTSPQRGSEEDLLSQKESLQKVSEELRPELGSAPHFTIKLPHTVPTRNGELTRLEVKVDGSPKPKVRWHKGGIEITQSKDFQIEEYEDGTSIFTITEVYPDDSGEVLCEAQNEYGIDTTKTELVVEDILGTKEYRKPEWVTHMEELKEALKEQSCEGENLAQPKGKARAGNSEVMKDAEDICDEKNHNSDSKQMIDLKDSKGSPEEMAEIVYLPQNKNVETNNYHLLSPIEESSEPSTAGSSNGGCCDINAKRNIKRMNSTLKLLSASCEALYKVDDSMVTELQMKYLTFPRSRVPVISPLRNNACFSVPEDPTMFPLEPRELNPASFNQLHMADSQEELQEFLLLESQCMTSDGRGLAAGFVVSEDDHSSDEDAGQITNADQ